MRNHIQLGDGKLELLRVFRLRNDLSFHNDYCFRCYFPCDRNDCRLMGYRLHRSVRRTHNEEDDVAQVAHGMYVSLDPYRLPLMTGNRCCLDFYNARGHFLTSKRKTAPGVTGAVEICLVYLLLYVRQHSDRKSRSLLPELLLLNAAATAV